jgi:glycosyltransferase involved in cell wall biosynthesis
MTTPPTPSDSPLVSVILPVYNGGDLLADSVRSVLEQTHRNLELILIDDGSTDDAVAPLRRHPDPRLRILQQPNGGKASAVNRGLDEARGEFVTLQDADDISRPDRLARLVREMREHPDLGAVFSSHYLILHGRDRAPQSRTKDQAECAELIQRMTMPAHDPTVMYRRSMLGDQRFSPDLRVAEGYDLILRMGEQYPMRVVGEPLYGYRVTPDSLTRSNVKQRWETTTEVFRRTCIRRGIDGSEILRKIREGYDRPVTEKDMDNKMATHFLESVCDLSEAGRRFEALRNGWVCLRQAPRRKPHWKPLLLALVPVTVQHRLRRQRRQAARGQLGLWGTRPGQYRVEKIDDAPAATPLERAPT